MSLALLPPAVRTQFATDPIRTLQDHLGLEVQCVEHLAETRSDGGACDGMSFLQDGVILYAPTPYSRRENFTLGHELGHWLVEQAEGVYDWLADQADPPRMLETVCDHIAQQLLLPNDVIEATIGRGPIRARHVIELFERSQASGPVCVIALARRLPALGAVIVVDCATGQIDQASVRPDPEQGWPTVFPWPSQPVPAGHPLLNLATGDVMTRRVLWRNRWGAQAEFYADSVNWNGTRIIAVFSDIDLWDAERLHLDAPREFDDRPSIHIRCCGQNQTVRGYPCPTCAEAFCPRCKRCRCDRVASREQACAGCYLRFQPHLLVDGRCEDCRE